jgi:hypothetical protein
LSSPELLPAALVEKSLDGKRILKASNHAVVAFALGIAQPVAPFSTGSMVFKDSRRTKPFALEVRF